MGLTDDLEFPDRLFSSLLMPEADPSFGGKGGQMCYTLDMEQEILQKLQAQDGKLEQIYQSVEKTRRYFLWTLIMTLVMFFLPLLGLIFAIPFFLNSLSAAYSL